MKPVAKTVVLAILLLAAVTLVENFLQDQAPYLASRAILMFKAAAGMDPVMSEGEAKALAAYQATVDRVVAKRDEILFPQH